MTKGDEEEWGRKLEDALTHAQQVSLARSRAEAAYIDPNCPVRSCDFCGYPYRGPAVYCSLACAEADA